MQRLFDHNVTFRQVIFIFIICSMVLGLALWACNLYCCIELCFHKGPTFRLILSYCFPGDSDGKVSVCNAGDLVRSLGWEVLLEKEMAAHSSILAWKVPWTVELGRLLSMGSQRIGHNWVIVLLYYIAVLNFLVISNKGPCIFVLHWSNILSTLAISHYVASPTWNSCLIRD